MRNLPAVAELARSTPSLIEDLRQPGVELVETHISWVFLRDDDVLKVKKPVDLGFLDFSTLEKRHTACAAECRLNRRLAPDVYLGCVPITRDPDGRHRIGGPGEPVEWAVQMKRLPEADRADIRLANGRLGEGHLERVARRLASFHAAARCDDETRSYGSTEAIAANLRENFEQTRETLPAYLDADQAREIEAWQHQFLDKQTMRFDGRCHAGHVRDGHGDLRLEHVYLDSDGEVVIVDCIEFNRRFRFADVCADVAFLAMDLTWQGHAELAERFLAAYARAAGDYDLYRLVDFYESYRAFVRGKIAALVAANPAIPSAQRQRAAREARRYFLLALASERRALLPARVIAVGGVIAAGKSTVAAGLAGLLGCPSIDTDHTRKNLLGVAPTQRVEVAAWSGAYSPASSREVYAEVFRRAEAVLSSGRTVILDASFHSRSGRQEARRLAARHRLPFLFVECRATPRLCRQRLHQRSRQQSVSDGRLEIFDDFLAGWQPVRELPAGEHLILDTSRPLAANLSRISDRLDSPQTLPRAD